MFFPRFIKWLSRLPAAYALGIIWWGEVTIFLCSIAGGHLLSAFLFRAVKLRFEDWLFPGALLTYFFVIYLILFEFGKASQLMEALLHIHRMGGPKVVDGLRKDAIADLIDRKGVDPVQASSDTFDPYAPPERIRASAGAFRIRYFIVLPTALVLYLMSFASTIYRIFVRQIQTWEPSHLVVPALAAAIVGGLCFWFLMPWLPGHVSMGRLLAGGPSGGD
jgi:hypothetical protein